jgi:hypothetical protein
MWQHENKPFMLIENMMAAAAATSTRPNTACTAAVKLYQALQL